MLTITFKQSQQRASVTIAKPAITASGSLVSKVKHHKVKKLTVVLKATDTANTTTRFTDKLKVK